MHWRALAFYQHGSLLLSFCRRFPFSPATSPDDSICTKGRPTATVMTLVIWSVRWLIGMVGWKVDLQRQVSTAKESSERCSQCASKTTLYSVVTAFIHFRMYTGTILLMIQYMLAITFKEEGMHQPSLNQLPALSTLLPLHVSHIPQPKTQKYFP